MSAREEIASTLAQWGLKSFAEKPAQHVLDALHAAGYRILAPGELDGETVEACIREVDCGCEKAHCPSIGFCAKDDVAALRSLSEQKP